MFLYIIFTLIILLGIIIYIYNKLLSKAKAVESSKMQIDIQLDRRFKVFESLIFSVKNIMDYEQTVLKEIVQLRSHAQSSKAKGDTKLQFDSEEKISKIANIVFESYPELKVLSNISQLQEDVCSTEKEIEFAKETYNNAIESYKLTKRSFLGSIVAKTFKTKLYFVYDYWQISKTKAQKYEDVTLKL